MVQTKEGKMQGKKVNLNLLFYKRAEKIVKHFFFNEDAKLQ